jgi:hypothetical protein
MIGQLFAGAGLGLLVGVLVGLSSSPVVAGLVGALAAGMVTLLGFARPAKENQQAQPSYTGYSEGSVVRLGSFGVACAAAVILGLFIRTHNWASPSIAEQVSEVQKAGYSGDEARRWVAYRNIGTATLAANSDASAASTHSTGGTASAAGSVLFSGANQGECQHFDTNRYKDAQEHLYALRQLGGKYAEYAEKISSLDASQQKTVLNSLRLLFCPQ